MCYRLFISEQSLRTRLLFPPQVGGNTLGLYGGVFSPDGEQILGHGFQGALHLWRRSQEESQHSEGGPATLAIETWRAQVATEPSRHASPRHHWHSVFIAPHHT